MAVKSIVSIDLDDTAFNKFAEAFAKYQAQLKETPKAWAEVGKQSGQTAITFEKLTAALLAQSVFSHELDKGAESQAKTVERQASAWDRISRSTQSAGRHIADATRSLLRWAEISGVVSGLLGAGGLWGIERLASSASNLRRSSLGLGTSAGGQQAFDVAFGRVVDPNSFLSGVTQGLYDVRGRTALLAAGLSPNQIAPGRDAAAVGADLIGVLKRIADQTPEALLGNVLTSRHLDQFIGLQDFIRLRRTPQAELGEYERTFGIDQQRFGLSDATLRLWQDFNVKLRESGKWLETAFIENLTPLAPALTRLSESFTGLVVKVLQIAKDDGLIDKFAQGIDWLGKEIGTPEFKQGVLDFTHGIVSMATAIANFVGWFGGRGARTPDGRLIAPSGIPFFQAPPSDNASKGKPWPGPESGYSKSYWELMHPATYFSGAGGVGAGSNFGSLEQQFRLPSGMLNTIEGMESGHGRSMISSAGAEGWFQFMPGTWQQYGGGGSPFNRGQAALAAAKYFRKLLDEFGGNVAEAVAGYNAGEGRVEQAIKQLGSRWLTGLPRETQNYVQKFLSQSSPSLMARSGQKVQIDINNYAGANTSVSASQLLRT